jgi:hypothetical protein
VEWFKGVGPEFKSQYHKKKIDHLISESICLIDHLISEPICLCFKKAGKAQRG